MSDVPPEPAYDAFSADELFKEFFWRWYKPLEREVRGRDALGDDVEPLSGSGESRLPSYVRGNVLRQLARMTDAARQDQASYLPPNGELGFEWLRAFEEHYSVREAQNLVVAADAENSTNDFVVLVCELGAVVGALLSQAEGLEWVPEAPYWESYLVDRERALVVRPFAAALRFMSTSRSYALGEWLLIALEPGRRRSLLSA
ncbi:MAG: hypothetical protein H6718_32450 [Polyangiaceae bacterium]|nr:hypothetical protein [Myxococcales bacterium]MCB9590170.1 hypothetical protein [Polyangiaceae bacterium]MCB9608049.1 hypothetical protein [Polyangiaceae bacterium]